MIFKGKSSRRTNQKNAHFVGRHNPTVDSLINFQLLAQRKTDCFLRGLQSCSRFGGASAVVSFCSALWEVCFCSTQTAQSYLVSKKWLHSITIALMFISADRLSGPFGMGYFYIVHQFILSGYHNITSNYRHFGLLFECNSWVNE